MYLARKHGVVGAPIIVPAANRLFVIHRAQPVRLHLDVVGAHRKLNATSERTKELF